MAKKTSSFNDWVGNYVKFRLIGLGVVVLLFIMLFFQFLVSRQDGKPETITPFPNEESQIRSASKNYCEAMLDEQGNPRSFSIGRVGSEWKEINIYSSDRDFAFVNVDCGGVGTRYYLKKVNDSWTVLFSSQQDDPEKNALYGIPSD